VVTTRGRRSIASADSFIPRGIGREGTA
jgi:hypothetical protein